MNMEGWCLGGFFYVSIFNIFPEQNVEESFRGKNLYSTIAS